MRLEAAFALAAVALVGGGCGSSGTAGSGGGGAGSGDEFFVMLSEENGSGHSGRATLTPLGDRTKVVLELESRSATPVAPRQPAHIHRGTCAKLDPKPAYGLSDVEAGRSTSVVTARLTDLRRGSFAINVHKSADETDTYVACGEVDTGRTMDYDPPGHDKVDDY